MKYFSLSCDGFLEFEGECQLDPRSPGEFLIPAHSTLIPPPEPKDGFNRIFNKDKREWTYQEIPVPPEPPKQPEPTWDQFRRSAYFDESDPLLYEYLFDADQKDKDKKVSKEEWIAKVKEIKERYPKPKDSSDSVKGVKQMAVVGAWYQIKGTLYVYVNKRGTVEKLGRPAWYKVLCLAIIQCFGNCKTVVEIKNFLDIKKKGKDQK